MNTRLITYTNAIFFLLLTIFSCGGDKKIIGTYNGKKAWLKKMGSYHIKIKGASGLSLGKKSRNLWIVSDSGIIYKTDKRGYIIKKIKSLKGRDLEGIAYNKKNNTLQVIDERTRELIVLSPKGKIKKYVSLQIPGKILNKGPEGLCIDKNSNSYVLNEAKPGIFLELKAKNFKIKKIHKLSFAQDYSAIYCSVSKNSFWILSDEDKLLVKWHSKKGILARFQIPIKKAEGLVLDKKNMIFYIVSDSKKKLIRYKLIR